MDVEDANHAASHEHGDGHQRAVVLAPEGGDVAVTAVLELVVHHRGLGVLGHPARDAFADGELDRTDQLVERGCRPGEHHLPLVLVDHVDEAHVGPGGGRDQPGDALGDLAQVEVGGGDVDDPPEQGVLGLGVGLSQERVGCAQWRIPSRMAVAMA